MKKQGSKMKKRYLTFFSLSLSMLTAVITQANTFQIIQLRSDVDNFILSFTNTTDTLMISHIQINNTEHLVLGETGGTTLEVSVGNRTDLTRVGRGNESFVQMFQHPLMIPPGWTIRVKKPDDASYETEAVLFASGSGLQGGSGSGGGVFQTAFDMLSITNNMLFGTITVDGSQLPSTVVVERATSLAAQNWAPITNATINMTNMSQSFWNYSIQFLSGTQQFYRAQTVP